MRDKDLLDAAEQMPEAYRPGQRYHSIEEAKAVGELAKALTWYTKEHEALKNRFGGCGTPLVMAQVALEYAYRAVQEIIDGEDTEQGDPGTTDDAEAE